MEERARIGDARPAAPGPATEGVVRAVSGARGLTVETADGALEATLATTGDYAPSPGDRVVVLPGVGRAYVVGVVRALRSVPERPASAEPAPVTTSDGVRATVDGGDVLRVTSPDGAVLFTHDARTGVSVVTGGRELLVGSPDGDVSVYGERVSIDAARSISLGVAEGSALSMDRQRVTVDAERIDGRAEEGRLSLGRAIFAAKRLEAAAETVKRVIGVLDTRANRIVERSRDSYREVEGVAQTRAGRMRTIARGAYQLVAHRATVKAEDDLSLMGEKIHLA